MKRPLLSFFIGLVLFGLLFFGLDFVLMQMQGLSLIYTP